MKRWQRFIRSVKLFRQLIPYFLLNLRFLPSAWRLVRGAALCALQFDRKQTTALPPHSLTIRITERCNLRCRQCGQWGEQGMYLKHPAEKSSAELSTAEIKRLIDELASARPFISFFGGEPLLRDDIEELIAHSNARNLLTGLTTNAVVLEERAERLLRSGLHFIKVSIDGPSEENDALRGKGTFEKAMRGLRHLVALRKTYRMACPIIQLNFTLTPSNQHVLYETALIAQKEGVDIFAVLCGILTTRKQIDQTNVILRREFNTESRYWPGFLFDYTGMDVETVEAQLYKIRQGKFSFILRQYPAETDAFNLSAHYMNPERVHGNGLCITPWFNMQVMPNGDVVLCEDTPDIVAGNIRCERPLSIWNGRVLQDFRSYILTHGLMPVCSRCTALYENAHPRNIS